MYIYCVFVCSSFFFLYHVSSKQIDNRRLKVKVQSSDGNEVLVVSHNELTEEVGFTLFPILLKFVG